MCLVLLNRKKKQSLHRTGHTILYIGNHAKKFKNWKTRVRCRMWVNNFKFL